jgi:hypothetical protein
VTVSPVAISLPDDHVWLRVADSAWADPLDPSYARDNGGHWNPPKSYRVLYFSEDLRTARAQLEELFAGWPVNVEDLADDAPYVLVVAVIPKRQKAADSVSVQGLTALGLPPSYPVDARGRVIARKRCQLIGAAVFDAALHGVWCRSAKIRDGTGRELAWFPRARAKARALREPVRLRAWWPAETTAALLSASHAAG